MLDFSGAELLLIIAVTVLVIGPKEIPQIMHGLGRIVRRFQYIRFALTQQFDEFMKDTDLDDLRRQASLQVVGDTDSEIEADEEYAMEPPAAEETESPEEKKDDHDAG